jgi:DNA-binding transcriptional LysR family regulator
MDRVAAIQAFVRVVESGTFARAAERLGASTSTLSRQIAELERHLGARLLNRTTRRLSLTEGGQAFYERAVQVLADLEEAEAQASSVAASPRGTLRLTCSHAMGVQRIAPAMASFVARYPEVRFEVSVSDRIVDLVEEGFDLAIRIGRLGTDQLVARRLGTMRLLACASPAYLKARGTPRVPADLAAHAVMTYAYSPNPRVWRLVDRTGRQEEVRVGGPLHSNSGDLAVAAAIAGLGIVFEPDFIVAPALAAGLLVRVLPEYESAPGDIWAVYPSRRHLSVKVRLFVDHIAQQFAAEAPDKPAAAPGR